MPSCLRRAAILTVFSAAASSAQPASHQPLAPATMRAAPAQQQARDSAVTADLARAKRATAAYRDIAVAHAAGFPTTRPACLTHPAHGVMGYHYMDRRIVDGKLEVEKPEILLYARDSAGKDYLTAIEYIMPLSAWTQPEPPMLFGQPLKRSEELKIWYLHVWLWAENPAGLFADYNPKVKC